MDSENQAFGGKSPYPAYDTKILECIKKGYLEGTSLRKFVKKVATKLIQKQHPEFHCSESCVSRIISRIQGSLPSEISDVDYADSIWNFEELLAFLKTDEEESYFSFDK